jgi:hypothetical protein
MSNSKLKEQSDFIVKPRVVHGGVCGSQESQVTGAETGMTTDLKIVVGTVAATNYQ